LKQLQSKYAADQSHGVAASTLSDLGKQIMAMANTLGQNVRLPSGSGTTRPAAPAPVASQSGQTGKIGITA
jgi:hypothetical protein